MPVISIAQVLHGVCVDVADDELERRRLDPTRHVNLLEGVRRVGRVLQLLENCFGFLLERELNQVELDTMEAQDQVHLSLEATGATLDCQVLQILLLTARTLRDPWHVEHCLKKVLCQLLQTILVL